MGNPSSQPDQSNQSSTISGNNQSSASINHFSHPHRLQLSQQTMINGSMCSGCKLEASGMMYSCTMCNYFLHQNCSQMPQQITHPYDQNHVLSLLAKPVYPEGLFSCDACGQQGNGFSYHCQVCGIDLHILCASSPMTFMHQSHQHQLQLTFSPPYPGKTFSCDICRMHGSNNWLYRCDMCQFDVHLTCVNKQPSAQVQTQSFMQQFQMMTRSNPQLLPQNSMPNNFMSNVNPQPQLFPQLSMPNNFMSNANPTAFNPLIRAGGIAQSQPQILGSTPFAATTPMPNYGMPMYNFMNTGPMGPPAGNAQGNGLMSQVIGGLANGMASGASQAIAGALMQDLMGGGGGGNNGGGINAGSAMETGFGGGMDVGYGDGLNGGYGGDASNFATY